MANELIYSSEEVLEPRKAWAPMSVIGQVQQIKAWLKKKKSLSEDQKQLAQRKEKKPCGSSSSLHKKQHPSKSTTHRQEIPKEQPEGKEKGKAQFEEALPSEVQNFKERKDRGPSQGFDANVLQRKSPEDKSLL
ncbi:hypothetical protein O181_073190 [Austropuccinia psidii MF-1]|uniref:Uncharacterized protein n=1 Tax=Austropuccinia psidii MF-1 TaxID=1389203 RepID=A0A9Q3F201_9BASI|nr:hypothetical protein [Austropuccinia psidii MF-1]